VKGIHPKREEGKGREEVPRRGKVEKKKGSILGEQFSWGGKRKKKQCLDKGIQGDNEERSSKKGGNRECAKKRIKASFIIIHEVHSP